MLGVFTRIAVVSSCKTLQCCVKGVDGPNILALEHGERKGCKLLSSFTNPAVKAIRKRESRGPHDLRFNVDAVIVSDIGPGAFEVFKAGKVKVYVVNEETKVKEAV